MSDPKGLKPTEHNPEEFSSAATATELPGGGPVIDFVRKAEAMHRRAQRAESELHRALKQLGHMDRMLRSGANRERKWRRRCQTARARLEAFTDGPIGQDEADQQPRDDIKTPSPSGGGDG